jgi:gas vesicle protein
MYLPGKGVAGNCYVLLAINQYICLIDCTRLMKHFLTGVATGLAIGYLIAPHSGKNTRSQLATAADNQKKDLEEQWLRIESQWGKTVEQVKHLIDTIKSFAP